MSDHYFACAREKNCVGIKKDMGGFHKCAAAADCKKPAKVKRKKTRKEKITEIVEDAVRAEPKLADVIADVIQPRRSTRVRDCRERQWKCITMDSPRKTISTSTWLFI